MRSTLAANTIRHLLSLRTKDGVWEGSLASSALSTATAVIALAANGSADKALVRRGRDWLAQHQNADGGWGDTVKSLSNISTTMLCRAALTLGKEAGAASSAVNLALIRTSILF